MTRLTSRLFTDWDQVPAEWRDPARAPTPFQTPAFLASWYETLGREPGISPAIVELRNAQGHAVALWPFAISVCKGLREVGFADGELTDNCSPLLGAAAPRDQNGLRSMWRSAIDALPAADILRVQKVPTNLGGLDQKHGLPRAYHGPLSRHLVDMSGSFEDYSSRRTTKFSKEQRRVWRVFTRNEGAKFEVLADTSRALMLFEQFEKLQETRMLEIGVDYRLGRPEYRSFWKRLIERGVSDGSVVFGALTAADELVGGVIGLTNGKDVAFVRICFAPGHWAVCSPGRLVLEKTLEALHAKGHREVDLSIGDFPYKSDFGVRLEPLYSAVIPLSVKGRPAWAAHAMRQQLKKSAWVRGLRARLSGGKNGAPRTS
jgi:CelD/BcsL family acetyltransferase involved in cellulose biosynthesis